MGKIIHPINFRKKRKNNLFLVFIVVIGVVIYFAQTNSELTTKTANSIRENGFGSILTQLAPPVAYIKPGNSALLATAKWVPQTFNNCVPAGTAMILQYFGHSVSQEETKNQLRTNADDKNVFISEVSTYLKNDYEIQNKVLFNGNLETIKTLVANGIYVAVEDFLHPNEDIGHFLIIRGFDDNERVLIADDSYFGVGIKYPYKTWDEGQWKPYNREFMPVYPREKEGLVKAIIGENWDEKTMYQNSVVRNQKDVDKNPNDMYALFNLGTSYFALGEFDMAKDAFEKSQAIGWPNRMLWYFLEPVQTYNKLGLYQKAIDTANLGLWFNDNYAEMHYEKAFAYKNLGDLGKSKQELDKAFSLDVDLKDLYNIHS
ncbi:MAG TPA: C39 family peptidase [Patescibacteria group bacterium]|nr:C39 family peptidase [Patescibacteria group bacterium]